jgi:hypothetical protein
MKKRRSSIVLALSLVLLTPVVAVAQQMPAAAPEPPVFTFNPDWSVPRALWDSLGKYFDRDTRPVLERRVADGTILSWGRYQTVVHQPNGGTDGFWWSATSMAALERVIAELLPTASRNPALLAATSHQDGMYRSIIQRRRPGAGSGYLLVSATQVQPGKGAQYRELWEKYTKPLYDSLLTAGVITMYSLDVEQVHTQNPGWRYFYYLTPTPDGVDKVFAAGQALGQRRGPDVGRAIADQFAEVTVAGAHWDFLGRVTGFAVK